MRNWRAAALPVMLLAGCAAAPGSTGEPTQRVTATSSPAPVASATTGAATPDPLPETDGIEVRPPSEGVVVGSTHLVFLGTQERDGATVARFINHGPLVEEGILVSEPFELPATDPAVVLAWGDELIAWEIGG